MIRKEAIELVAKQSRNYPIISANGFISRDLFQVCDKNSNFYMIGSMGLASSIALGIAIKNPKKRILVFDGDGNVFMNMGSLATIGSLQQKNLIHYVFDNQSHESTGGQPTHSSIIQIEKIEKSVNYSVFKTRTKKGLEKILRKIKNLSGPILVLIKVDTDDNISKRINLKCMDIRDRFMKSL